MEAVSAGQADVDKRASLPVGPMSLFPESHPEPREGALRQVPGAGQSPQEANGPCSGPSPPLEQRRSPGTGTKAEGGMVKAKGGDVVEVVWEGLRGPQDCAMSATGPELEARVEQVVLEAIGDRQGPGSPELPAWVREDRGIVEVVWEGLGGSDPKALEEVGSSDPGLQERLGAMRSSIGEPDRQGKPGGDEGSFIWVERVTVSEDWEELLMEGLEGPLGSGREAVKGPPGTDGGGYGDTWAAEKRAEGHAEAGERGTEESQGTEWGRVKRLPEGTRTGRWASSELEGTAGEQKEGAEKQDVDGPLRAERGHREEKPGVEMERTLGEDEERSEGRAKEKAEEPAGPERAGKDRSPEVERGGGEEWEAGELGGEEPLRVQEKGSDEEPRVPEELLGTERTDGEKLSEAERTGGEEPVMKKRKEGEELLGAERTGNEKPLVTETTGGEELSEAERIGDEKLLVTETTGGEELMVTRKKEGEELSEAERIGDEKPLVTKMTGGEELSEAERTEGEEPIVAKRKEGEELLGAEGTPGGPDLHSGTEQREAGEGRESQAEEGSEAGATLGVTQELAPELEVSEKQEVSPEEEGGAPQPPAEAQGPGDATPLLTETPAPDQPTESQPLLLQERPSTNPSAHPAPTYAPTRQPEPTSHAEAEEASGPKHRTCQCCAVM